MSDRRPEVENEPVVNPFLGPRPFTASESDRFFARDELARELTVLAQSQRVLILDGPSGAGKTSLLQAAVIPELQRRDVAVLPVLEINALAPGTLGLDTAAGAYWHRYVNEQLLAGADVDESRHHQGSAPDALAFVRRSSPAFRDDSSAIRVLVIDQLNDLFADRQEIAIAERERFIEALARAMDDDNQLHLVFVVDQSDLNAARALATRLPVTTPPVLLHVPHFTQDEATLVVERTANLAGLPVDVARIVRLATSATRPTNEFGIEAHPVDPILLQTVARRMVAGAETYDAEEGERPPPRHLDGPLRQLFADVVSDARDTSSWNERRVRDWSAETLISPLGTRAIVPEPSAEAPERQVLAALLSQTFVEGAPGGSGSRLAHDRLVPEIVTSNRGFGAWRPLWLLVRVVGAAAAVLLIVGVLASGVAFQRNERVGDLEGDVRMLEATVEVLEEAQTIDVLALDCAPNPAFVGDLVRCVAAVKGNAETLTWSTDEIERHEGVVFAFTVSDTEAVELRFEACGSQPTDSEQERECRDQTLTVPVLAPLSITPGNTTLTNGIRSSFVVQNASPDPQSWALEFDDSRLAVEPASGVVPASGVATVVVRRAPSGPPRDETVQLTFLLGTDGLVFDTRDIALGNRPQPVVSVPGDLGPGGLTPGEANVVFPRDPSASDPLEGPLPVICSAESGSVFTEGETEVVCVATNSGGQQARASFTVTIAEVRSGPVLVLRDQRERVGANAESAPVGYVALAFDAEDHPIVPMCNPASGSDFSLGESVVTCSATDGAGLTATGTFTVTLIPVVSVCAEFLPGANPEGCDGVADFWAKSDWPQLAAEYLGKTGN